MTEDYEVYLTHKEISLAWKNWFKKVMPDASTASFVIKLKEESQEFIEHPSLEEAADVMACLWGWACRSGYSYEEFKQAYLRKLHKNHDRKFELQEDGTYHHVS